MKCKGEGSISSLLMDTSGHLWTPQDDHNTMK